MTKTDKGIELLKENPFMGVKEAAKKAGIKRDTLKTALSQQGIKVSDLKQQYVEQLEAAAPEEFEFKPKLKGDDNMAKHEDMAVLIDGPNFTIIDDKFEQIINIIQEYEEVKQIFDNFNSLIRYTEQQGLGKKYEYYANDWDVFREELHNWIKQNFAELFDYLSFENKQKLDEYVIDDVFSEKELTEILQDGFPEYWKKVAK